MSWFLRSLLCRMLGHRWQAIATFSPEPSVRKAVAICRVCSKSLVRSSTSPSRPSSSFVVMNRHDWDAMMSVAAWHPVWAQALDAHTSPSPKAPDTASPSAPHGAGR